MLKQRLIFGALGIVAALFVLLFCSVNVISLCVGVIALIGMYEFFKVTGLVNKKTPALYLGFVFALVLYTVAIFNSGFLKENLMPFIAAYVFILMVSMVLFHSNLTFSDAALSFLGTLYISIFFLHIIFIRQSELGNLNIWLIFISAWATDTFAYFAGRTLGKHKLCPKVSPKKTVEGAIGGTLGCVICICVYAYLCGKCKVVSVNYISATFFAILTAVFSQFGDLAASRIKREYGVKDYGNLIPGHGGILDRFDSALLISPLVYYFTLYFPIIIK